MKINMSACKKISTCHCKWNKINPLYIQPVTGMQYMNHDNDQFKMRPIIKIYWSHADGQFEMSAVIKNLLKHVNDQFEMSCHHKEDS